MSGNLYFLFLLFKNMDSIDRILNFINSAEEPEDARNEVRPEQETQEQQQIEETPKEPEISKTMEQSDISIAEELKKPEYKSPQPEEYTNEKRYKTILRKANNVLKKNQFPAVISVDGKNSVFPGIDDLKLYIEGLKTEHRQYNRKRLNDKINSYKHFNEEYTTDINDIEEDGIIYKKGNIKAITKDNKRYKVPSTSKKDREQIYNKLKRNKKVLTDLVKSKDNEEFNDISISNIDNDGKELIEKHKDNTINNDKTWTRDEFIKMMEQLMKKREGQETTIKQETRPKFEKAYINDAGFRNTYSRQQKPATNTPGGLNPFLLSPRI